MASAFTTPKYKSSIKHTIEINHSSDNQSELCFIASEPESSQCFPPKCISIDTLKHHPPKNISRESDTESTEDEEVKSSCARGIQPYATTDESSTEESYDDGDENDDDDGSSSVSSCFEDVGLMKFVSKMVQQQSRNLHKPVPIQHDSRGDVEEESSISSESSVASHGSETDGYDASISDASGDDGKQGELSLEESDDGSESGSTLASEPCDTCISSQSEDVFSQTIDNRKERDSAFSTDFSIDTADPPFLLDMEMALSANYGEDNDFEYTLSSDDETSSIFENEIMKEVERESSSMKRSPPSSTPEGNPGVALHDTPKRIKLSQPYHSPTAADATPEASAAANDQYRQMEGIISPISEEGEAVDNRLREELCEPDLLVVRESTPVPLISPPPSPLRVESDQGPTTVCEWPCNLAIDNALTAVRRMRAPSPDALGQLEAEEEQRISAFLRNQPQDNEDSGPLPSVTPLLRGVQC